MRRLSFYVLLSVLAACTTDLGPCDEAAAKTLVYDEHGTPAYEGQAMLMVSCGNGTFCHSQAAEGAQRQGVPRGLDFDMHLALGQSNAAALRDGVSRVRKWRHEIYDAVESGRMPPFGRSGLLVFDDLPRYLRIDDAEVVRAPAVDSEAGLDVLRNWLSCGAPVVERTTMRPSGAEVVGDIVPINPDVVVVTDE